jgi:hypothetical protein
MTSAAAAEVAMMAVLPEGDSAIDSDIINSAILNELSDYSNWIQLKQVFEAKPSNLPLFWRGGGGGELELHFFGL